MLNADINLMRQMFLLGAMYAAKATRTMMAEKSLDDLFVNHDIREAAEEVVSEKRSDDSKFAKLMRRMGVDQTPDNATAIIRLVNTLQREADNRKLDGAVNRFRIAQRLRHAATEAKFKKELEDLLAKQQRAAIDEPATV